jgi:hypothetical protein
MRTNVDDTLALATLQIAPLVTPGWNVRDNAPETLEACTAAYQESGKVIVFPGDYQGALFADAHCNEAFNAWHDWCHIKGQYSFDLEGEKLVHSCMESDLCNWWQNSRVPVIRPAYERARALLRQHNVGRLEYWLATNEPPKSPRDFAHGYLAAVGMAAKVPMCKLPRVDQNEWTNYDV